MLQIVGEVASVRDALVQIVLRLRDDVLKNRDGSGRSAPPPHPPGESSAYASGIGASIPSSMMPSIPHLGFDQQRADHSAPGLAMLSSSSIYGYGSLPVFIYASLVSYHYRCAILRDNQVLA